MRIKTITCHHAYNHGAMLQAYALVTYLRSLGHDVDVIDYRPFYMPERYVNFRRVPSRFDKFAVRLVYQWAKRTYNELEQKRRNAFEPFFEKYIPTTAQQWHDIEELRKNPPEADIYIAGSDQIWNTSFPNGKDASFYLDFGTPKRKISYAASFATDALSCGSEDFVKNKLQNFDAISVRESSALSILKSLGLSGELVVDPVFLLSKEDWDVFDNGVGCDEDYILTYDFEAKGGAVGAIARRMAKLYNCKVFSIGPFNFRYADKSYVAYGPDTFISLIKNARCIVSNSFHGSAFSMIYGKNFFVVNRKDGLNIRMKDLLMHFNLIERVVDLNVEDITLRKSIDYNRVSKILQKDINESKVFLFKQIDVVDKG